MAKIKNYEVYMSKLLRGRVKCTIEEFKLITDLCVTLNENEKSFDEYILSNPNSTLLDYSSRNNYIIAKIKDDLTWGWESVNENLVYFEFSEVVKPLFNNSDSISEETNTSKEAPTLKQGTIVRAIRNNGDNPPYIWQGVYFGYCNDKHLIDFNGTHCMVADEIEVVPTLSKKEAKQKVSELFANNGKNVSSQKIREIIDLIELDDCSKGKIKWKIV